MTHITTIIMTVFGQMQNTSTSFTAWLYSGYLMKAREEKDVQVRPGDRHSRKICRR